jgi:hypothetical protein
MPGEVALASRAFESSEQIGSLAKALAAAQNCIQGASKDKTNPHFKNRYADLASVWDACREALTANGLSVTQAAYSVPAKFITDNGELYDGEQWLLRTVLMHESGQWIAGSLPIYCGANMQQLGSAVTYARRYGLAAIVGVAPEDDDAEAAVSNHRQPQPVHQNRDGHRGDRRQNREKPRSDQNEPTSGAQPPAAPVSPPEAPSNPAPAPAPAAAPSSPPPLPDDVATWFDQQLARTRRGWEKAKSAEPKLQDFEKGTNLPCSPDTLLFEVCLGVHRAKLLDVMPGEIAELDGMLQSLARPYASDRERFHATAWDAITAFVKKVKADQLKARERDAYEEALSN